MRKILMALSSGYILMFFSEQVFWSRYKPGEDSLPDLLLTWLAYSLLAYLFLSAVKIFRVRSVWALFLCGALFGWLAEGVLVQTMYDQFPINLAWTGLAWHALISVLFGWFYLRKVLLENKYRKTILVSFLAGLLWGFWAISWWLEEPANRASLTDFSLFAFTAALFLILNYWIYARVVTASFAPGKWELFGLIGLLLLNFVFVAVPAMPFAALILPALMYIVLLALKFNRRAESRPDLIAASQGKVKSLNYLSLFALPLAAVLIYALADRFGIEAYTNYVVFSITTIAGGGMFFISLIQVFRLKPPESLPDQEIPMIER